MGDTDWIAGTFKILEENFKDWNRQFKEIGEKVVLVADCEVFEGFHSFDLELHKTGKVAGAFVDVVCDSFRLQTRVINVVDQRNLQLRDFEQFFVVFRQKIVRLHQQFQTVLYTHNVPDPHFALQHPFLAGGRLVEHLQQFWVVFVRFVEVILIRFMTCVRTKVKLGF